MIEADIRKENKQYKISNLTENKSFCFSEDKQINYSPIIGPYEGDIVISDDFLICIANLDVLSDLNIPAIFVQVVKQNNWKKLSL